MARKKQPSISSDSLVRHLKAHKETLKPPTGKTQAEALGVPWDSLRKWYTGTVPCPARLKLLAPRLGVNISQLTPPKAARHPAADPPFRSQDWGWELIYDSDRYIKKILGAAAADLAEKLSGDLKLDNFFKIEQRTNYAQQADTAVIDVITHVLGLERYFVIELKPRAAMQMVSFRVQAMENRPDQEGPKILDQVLSGALSDASSEDIVRAIDLATRNLEVPLGTFPGMPHLANTEIVL